MEPYKNPRNLFEQRLSNILKKEVRNSQVFEQIFKLQQALSLEKLPHNETPNQDNWKVLLEIYMSVGSEHFSKLVSLVKGRSVTFPSELEYQDSIITTLCYFYREVEGRSWEQVKELLNIKNLNTIKYGIRVRQLKSFIDQQLLKHFK